MQRPTKVTDAGRRASDTINLHITFNKIADVVGRWVAIRLSDGGSDHVLYDTRGEAIKHQLHETQCAYIQIPVDGATPEDMTRFLEIVRDMYDNGVRLADPINDPIGVIFREV